MTPEVTNASVAKHLSEAVQGVSVDVGKDASELSMFADMSKIKKIYKFNDSAAKGKGGKKVVTADQAASWKDERSALENAIMGKVG